MNLLKISLGIVLVFSSNQLMATEWEKIIQTKQEVIYVDSDSFDQTDNLPSMIVKHARTKQPSGSLLRYQFNCSQHLFRTLEATNGLKLTTKPSFKPIQANSQVQQIESLTCQIHKMLGGS